MLRSLYDAWLERLNIRINVHVMSLSRLMYCRRVKLCLKLARGIRPCIKPESGPG